MASFMLCAKLQAHDKANITDTLFTVCHLRRKSAEVAVDYLFEGRLRNCVNRSAI
jgi:hypothetical protein